MLRHALIIIAVTALGGLALACSSGGDGSPSATGDGITHTQTVSVGGVEVEATWPGGGGETPDGLVVNYHCCADPSLSVESVHAAIDEIERRLRVEFPGILRIAGHAEIRDP